MVGRTDGRESECKYYNGQRGEIIFDKKGQNARKWNKTKFPTVIGGGPLHKNKRQTSLTVRFTAYVYEALTFSLSKNMRCMEGIKSRATQF